MPAPLVPINTADAGELTRLYGIGPELARRIVADREANGPFVSSDDLARVEGLSADLAMTLAPHIDWHIVQPAARKKKERQWKAAFRRASFALVLLWFAREDAADVINVWQAQKVGAPVAPGGLVTAIMPLVNTLSLTLCFVLLMFAAIIQDQSRANRLIRVAIFSLIVFGFSLVARGVTSAVYYQVESTLGGTNLVRNSIEMAWLISGLIFLIWGLPVIAVLWRPALAYNAALARLVDVAFLLVALAPIAFVWLLRGELPVVVAVILGANGLLYAAIGYLSIRNREPFLSAVARLALPTPDDRQTANTSAWMTWLNNRMPDPEKQVALQRALNKTYPPSRTRTLIKYIVFGIGGWFILTALEAIVEWLVQGWLGNLIR
jgi:competence ComEA-like helix-hairpin-helix protein